MSSHVWIGAQCKSFFNLGVMLVIIHGIIMIIIIIIHGIIIGSIIISNIVLALTMPYI